MLFFIGCKEKSQSDSSNMAIKKERLLLDEINILNKQASAHYVYDSLKDLYYQTKNDKYRKLANDYVDTVHFYSQQFDKLNNQ